MYTIQGEENAGAQMQMQLRREAGAEEEGEKGERRKKGGRVYSSSEGDSGRSFHS